MRYFCLVAALTAACSLSGCQSCTQPVSLPIVGDSMSHWAPAAPQCGGPVTGPMLGGLLASGGGPLSCGCGNAGGLSPCNGSGCGKVFAGGAYGGYAEPLMSGGCAGATCNGSCGGQCRIALSRMHAAVEKAKAQAMNNHPHMAAILQRNARRCAYGSCGARPGPQQGMATFPYYAVRGPRDFLAAKPPSIGP